jgi:hypothetical protein
MAGFWLRLTPKPAFSISNVRGIDKIELLCQKPFKIIADLMQFGIYAQGKDQLDFETVSKVAWNYGLIAKRAD